MKVQAKEEKLRRQIERSKLAREKQLREEAEREKMAMEKSIAQYQEELRLAKEALQRSEESAELLAEKSMVAEHEAMLLQQKARYGLEITRTMSYSKNALEINITAIFFSERYINQMHKLDISIVVSNEDYWCFKQ